MDINMPGIGGIEAVRRIHAAQPDVRVLMVTMLEDDSVFVALRAGARGYVIKGAEPTEVLRAIHSVADGEAIFSPGIAERMLRFFSSQRGNQNNAARSNPDPTFAELTEREHAVLSLIARRLTNVQHDRQRNR
jgi:DNA-binding NarL/FixJ family response regulator